MVSSKPVYLASWSLIQQLPYLLVLGLPNNHTGDEASKKNIDWKGTIDYVNRELAQLHCMILLPAIYTTKQLLTFSGSIFI